MGNIISFCIKFQINTIGIGDLDPAYVQRCTSCGVRQYSTLSSPTCRFCGGTCRILVGSPTSGATATASTATVAAAALGDHERHNPPVPAAPTRRVVRVVTLAEEEEMNRSIMENVGNHDKFPPREAIESVAAKEATRKLEELLLLFDEGNRGGDGDGSAEGGNDHAMNDDGQDATCDGMNGGGGNDDGGSADDGSGDSVERAPPIHDEGDASVKVLTTMGNGEKNIYDVERTKRKDLLTEALRETMESITCPVCLEPYVDPCTLPCGHSLCAKHVSRMVASSSSGGGRVVSSSTGGAGRVRAERGVSAPSSGGERTATTTTMREERSGTGHASSNGFGTAPMPDRSSGATDSSSSSSRCAIGAVAGRCPMCRADVPPPSALSVNTALARDVRAALNLAHRASVVVGCA